MFSTPFHFRWTALAVVLGAAGCGERAEPDLELAQQSVRAALDTWKRGDSADVLKTRPLPIEFYDDDWQAGARLIEYKLSNTYRDTDGGPRCAVELTVQPKRGEMKEIQVTYQLNTTPKIVIARDPYS